MIEANGYESCLKSTVLQFMLRAPLPCTIVGFWFVSSCWFSQHGRNTNKRCARSSQRKLTKIFLAGLPRIWSTSFCLVVTWLTERTYVRTRLQIVRVGQGRQSKGREGFLRGVLVNIHIFYIGHLQYGPGDSQLTAVKTG